MPESSQLSIVIPTKDRHHFLERTLTYLTEEKCPYKIIIGDCSKIDFNYARYKDTSYFNFPEEIIFCDKAIECLKKVTTPYVVMLGDDDFFNLSLLPRICDFLNNNEDYVAADGKEIRVLCHQNGIDKNIFHTQHALSENDCIARSASHCKLYWPTFYCVHRTAALIKSFEVTKKVESSGYLFQELAGSIATILQGKYYTFPDLYLIRQNFHAQSTATIWWTDLLKLPDFKEKNMLMINELIHLGKKLSLSHDSFNHNALEKSVENFYIQFRQENKRNTLKSYVNMILPKSIKVLIRRARDKILPPQEKKMTPSEETLLNSDFYLKVKKILSSHPFGIKN